MAVLNLLPMQKLNLIKIYSLAIFHLIAPKAIKHKFYFKTSLIENLAIGTTMTKIKYWRYFIRKHKLPNKIDFINQDKSK